MSACLVGKAHIDALVNVAFNGPKSGMQRWDAVSPYENWSATDPNTLGRLLWQENDTSVCHRYPDCAPDSEVADYQFAYPTRRLTIVEALKAITCYEYQSCEHPGWEASDAYRLCERVRGQLICTMPGYDAADWEVVA